MFEKNDNGIVIIICLRTSCDGLSGKNRKVREYINIY